MATAGGPKARRYAQAVFELGLEQGTFEEWERDLAVVEGTLEDEGFAMLLDAPSVPIGVKVRGVREILANTGPLVRNLVGLLAERGQVREVGAIRAELARLVDEHRGIARAEVVTAVLLDDVQRGRVERFLSELAGKQAVVTESVDPSILGGLVARVGDLLVDGSLRTRLRTLGERLEEPPERVSKMA